MGEGEGADLWRDGHDAVSTHQQAGHDPSRPLTLTHLRVARGSSEVSLSAAPESLASAGPTVLSQIGQGCQTPACGMTHGVCVKSGLGCVEMGWKGGSGVAGQVGGLGGSSRVQDGEAEETLAAS